MTGSRNNKRQNGKIRKTNTGSGILVQTFINGGIRTLDVGGVVGNKAYHESKIYINLFGTSIFSWA